MNRMEDIAEMLGIELNTVFYVTDVYNNRSACVLTEEGLKHHFVSGDWILSSGVLEGLLAGRYWIIEKPFKPNFGDDYYHPSLCDSSLAMSKTWLNDLWDNNLYNRGLVYRTKEEAQKVCEAMLKTVKKIEV